jgi:anaerobic magnesium-protoporphyrin IX monomethyl ester cyclase
MEERSQITQIPNKGNHPLKTLQAAVFPNADQIVGEAILTERRTEQAVDILLVNPPTPDGGYWIRSQHRVGRRTRENMVWPQVSLAQMAALLHPAYKVKIIDANAERMGWEEFGNLIDTYKPLYYLTQVTAPSLENDMYGTFLAKQKGATTIAFGTHVTPLPVETMRVYPSLDFCLYGEPDITLRDLIDHLEDRVDERTPEIQKLFEPAVDTTKILNQPVFGKNGHSQLDSIKGLVWRKEGQIVINEPRPFIQDLDDLPMPLHELLPLQKYRMPFIKGLFTFIVTSRGCPAGCLFCIKHVTYQNNVRLRSPEKILEELWLLKKLGVNNIHMYADLFTVSRQQVMALCKLIIDSGLSIRWMCNSRVDFVDPEMLQLMSKAGCWLISWGIESGNPQILKNIHKGIKLERAKEALLWSKKAGIANWGYFIIGLPGETEATIQDTIRFSKSLPLDIALFHIAAPYPGTPLFFLALKNGWFRPGTRWEQVDMDKETVLDYPGLSAERIQYWQKRAFREWAFRPGPMMTYMKMLLSDLSTVRSAIQVGLQHLNWSSK